MQVPNYSTNPVGQDSPLLLDDCLKEFCVCTQFAVLGDSQITNPKWIAIAASRPSEASWSKSVQKILNELKMLSSDDRRQLVTEAQFRSWIGASGEETS